MFGDEPGYYTGFIPEGSNDGQDLFGGFSVCRLW
ncbi:hypothetical protein ACP_1121 [Acidobacterium capsulatum ATCC 51196]|uniref:Uncharacterized protein n=1 Tax=Acidobacterium capsulatum (strain ATCC 51196 / DSM 11244 / BCRC 80197 / JCM 7670 / NBRC 15755 / NCIMB 13165 / 161) TaxID=240015 RepID=C1F492_ACIC5|nr:hypothetical protein ACP_1121 [Acidobacterium capsulatum ATCC 51196]